MSGFARPNSDAVLAIERRHNRVPGPLYASVVAVSRKSNGRHCISCESAINGGDEYICNYRPDIFLCARCIQPCDPFGDGSAWQPGTVRGDSRSSDSEPVPEPSVTLDNPVTGVAGTSPKLSQSFFGAGVLRRLEEQGWRCAYPCEAPGVGGKLLPGDDLALAFDNYGLIHRRCADYARTPAEGNPWGEEANG